MEERYPGMLQSIMAAHAAQIQATKKKVRRTARARKSSIVER